MEAKDYPVPPSSSGNYKTEILRGAEAAVGRGVEFMANVKRKMDLCYDYRAPSIVIEVPEYRNGYLGVRSRGGEIRVVTDITKDNLQYCKELLKIVQLRHLEEVRGGIAVSESEYMATTVLEEAKPLTQVIYSNVPEVVAQGQHIFDVFWNLAIPADQRIRELEEGIVRPRTRILEGRETIAGQIVHLAETSTRLSIVSSVGGMQLIRGNFFDLYRKAAKKLSETTKDSAASAGLRWVTTLGHENIDLANEFLEIGVAIRHVDSLPPLNFAVGDKELNATIEKMQGGKMVESLLTSNEVAYVDHFRSIFDKLWEQGIDASARIAELVTGTEAANIEIIRSPKESIARAWDSIISAREEVLILFSTAKAFRRQIDMGGLAVLQKASENGCRIRVLIPADGGVSPMIEEARIVVRDADVRAINEELRTNMTILVVDKKECFIFELKDDTRKTSYEAVGLSMYSNSRSIVSSYATILDSLWRETDLYQKLQTHERMQREFIDIATHELRTPIQPILGLSETLASRTAKDSEDKQLLDAIWRNAKRLKILAEAILDVTKLESHALNLKKEEFDLNDVIANAVNDAVMSPSADNGMSINVVYADKHANVLADKERIHQVISNLLTNAIKFTVKGKITILVRVEEGSARNAKGSGTDSSQSRKLVVVRVKDSGPGISSVVFSKLFTKFATGSASGTGLGLYISKGIIDAHGGSMNAENNRDCEGATFTFSLDLHSDKKKQ